MEAQVALWGPRGTMKGVPCGCTVIAAAHHPNFQVLVLVNERVDPCECLLTS